MEGVDIVLGHTGKFSLVEQITGHINTEAGSTDYHGAIYPGRPIPDSFVPSYSSGDRTRSFLKIQDGCDYFCTYCTIPLARGRSRSDTIENVVRNAREILAGGAREIVLTGVNIGDFGRSNGESFLELIRSLDGIKELDRLRISSIEPDLLSDDIIDFVAGSERIMPHFHIPLQSGCDRILNAMNRKYGTGLYASRVTRIREKLPLACIAADVIVGFPGETDEDFRATYKFLERLPVSYMHVFSYSSRENTRAANMADPVRDIVKKERSEALHELSDRKKKRFYQENLGTEAEVLFESDNTNGFMHGFTQNYIRVKTRFNPELINRIVPVSLENVVAGEFVADRVTP
jgi:threonylcarbamoyladenosine tRNA methylthiotransferase MtaB